MRPSETIFIETAKNLTQMGLLDAVSNRCVALRCFADAIVETAGSRSYDLTSSRSAHSM